MMPGPSAPMPKRVLSLTKEEAFALLEMCAATLVPEKPDHLLVLSRLSSLCREGFQTQPTVEEVPHEGRLPLPCPAQTVTCSC